MAVLSYGGLFSPSPSTKVHESECLFPIATFSRPQVLLNEKEQSPKASK